MEFSNVIYFSNLNSIGGVESWLYYISKLFGEYDINIVYKTGDAKQIKRIAKNVRCIKWSGTGRIKCKRLFINYFHDILDYAEADKVYFFIHSDYKDLISRGQMVKNYATNIASDTRITNFVAVSKLAADSFYELTGIMPDICYNPIAIDPPQKIIRLCSAQRMTQEKGGKRISTLIDALSRYCSEHTDVTYQWDIYTIDKDITVPPNVRYLPPNLNVSRLLYSYDYFVALSDSEGYCYSVVEALCSGTPCIVTPCPVFDELGLNTSNSIKLNFDCGNIGEVVNSIFTKDLRGFKYSPPKSNLDQLLLLEPSTYTEDEKAQIKVNTLKVKCERNFYDVVLGKHHRTSDAPFEVDLGRAEYLVNRGLVRIVNGKL